MTIVPRDYRNQSFALGSMHGKQRAILPALRRHLAARVLLTRALDTDSFGTFTGETRRCGSMRDAARSKARAAIDEVGVPLGLGNEGSFGPHPAIPFAACDAEILLLVDARDGREIHESVLSIRTNFAYMICRPGDDLTDFLARIGFPAHALVAMPNNPSDGFRAIKGLAVASPAREAHCPADELGEV